MKEIESCFEELDAFKCKIKHENISKSVRANLLLRWVINFPRITPSNHWDEWHVIDHSQLLLTTQHH